MLGVFDSGVGGYSAVYELRARLPRADILYLADRKNDSIDFFRPSYREHDDSHGNDRNDGNDTDRGKHVTNGNHDRGDGRRNDRCDRISRDSRGHTELRALP